MDRLMFLFVMIGADPQPVLSRVEGPIDLATLSVARARDLTGIRCRFVVWPSSLTDEHEGQKNIDCWHSRGVHCLVRFEVGVDPPDAAHFAIEGTLRVWDVPPYTINGKHIDGWTMIRVENAGLCWRKPD